MKKSLILTNILLGTTILFNGCGGGGGSSAASSSSSGTITNTNTSSISTLFGIVSDGPIKNARVFLDVNNNGVYNEGEPYDITNSKGEYSIPYVLKPGLEYMLIAEGTTALETEDTTTDNIGLLDFNMFLNVKADGKADDTSIVGKTYKKDLTPITFKNYLANLKVENSPSATYINAYIENLATTSLSDGTKIFQDFILTNSTDNSVSTISGTIATSNDIIITAASNSENKYIIPDDVLELKELKDSLIEGNSVDDIIGIKSLIGTKIAFDIMNSYVGTELVSVNVNGVSKTIKFIKNDNIITAIFKETVSNSDSTGSVSAEYEGIIIFNSDLTLLSANYTQKHTQTSNLNIKNSVSGIIEISNVSSIYNLNLLNGTFSINTPLYGDVKGDVTIKGATTLDSSNILFNSNNIETTTTYTLKTKSEPVKKDALYAASLVGLWSGNITTNSCISIPEGTINLNITDEYIALWQAQSNGKTYGTELSISDSKITFKDSVTNNNTTWSIGTILNNEITGTWNDALNNCTGTYSLSKAQVN
jgi:hypothetical protein